MEYVLSVVFSMQQLDSHRSHDREKLFFLKLDLFDMIIAWINNSCHEISLHTALTLLYNVPCFKLLYVEHKKG